MASVTAPMRRTRITLTTNKGVILEQDNGGSEMSYLDLRTYGVLVEERVNADGSVRVGLVFDCDFYATERDNYEMVESVMP